MCRSWNYLTLAIKMEGGTAALADSFAFLQNLGLELP